MENNYAIFRPYLTETHYLTQHVKNMTGETLGPIW